MPDTMNPLTAQSFWDCSHACADHSSATTAAGAAAGIPLDGLPWQAMLLLGVLTVLSLGWRCWLRYRISRQAMKRVAEKDVVALFSAISDSESRSHRTR
ncbi:hypothetical protein [Streptomyces sp. NBC_01727]|uniref:hypothetical protein n=1 Tax=Streptomyces sp. NBC_01727 TaxID=2975924 RepID=UPI002E106094|nr:hypothetical protein OIE76_43775 [Streptomyces sp. NBC_01727]